MKKSKFTEVQINAPFVCKFTTQKKLGGGEYGINLYFTYFNGREWKVDRQIINFSIRSLFDRNQWWAWALGIFITSLTLIPRGL